MTALDATGPLLAAALLPAFGCNQPAKLTVAEGTGAGPTLPEAHRLLLPTVDVAPAIGWSEGEKPTSAAGTRGTGLAAGTTLPAPFREGMFVGEHGSWNRHPRSGYKVVFVPFADDVGNTVCCVSNAGGIAHAMVTP